MGPREDGKTGRKGGRVATGECAKGGGREEGRMGEEEEGKGAKARGNASSCLAASPRKPGGSAWEALSSAPSRLNINAPPLNCPPDLEV